MYSGYIDLSYLIHMLMSYIDIQGNKEVTLQILEILRLILGCQTYENPVPKLC